MNNKTFSDKVRFETEATSRNDKATAIGSTLKPRYTKTKRIINLVAVITTAAVSSVTWAAPHGGDGGVAGGGHFGGSGRVGGFAGGVSRATPAFSGGGLRSAPVFQGAYFTGRSVVEPSQAPHFYYRGAGMPTVDSPGATASDNRPTIRIAGRTSSIGSQQDRAALLARQNTRAMNSQMAATNRTNSIAGRNRVSDPRTSTTANRQSFVRNHASERHGANNWHRDWDRHRAHFHNNRVFVFIGGFWWGLYPSDYYAYGDPYDYDNSYPYDYYNDYPYSYYDSSPSDYDQQPAYDSDQYGNSATISAVQSELAKLGYYRGAVDGVEGDETQAALARYQEDHDLSVTGTLTAATLQSLGLLQRAS